MRCHTLCLYTCKLFEIEHEFPTGITFFFLILSLKFKFAKIALGLIAKTDKTEKHNDIFLGGKLKCIDRQKTHFDARDAYKVSTVVRIFWIVHKEDLHEHA